MKDIALVKIKATSDLATMSQLLSALEKVGYMYIYIYIYAHTYTYMYIYI